jgi:hypothetical protein
MQGNDQGVRIFFPDEHEDAIDILVSIHDPNALSEPEQEESEREAVRILLRNSPLAGKTPDEVYSIVQGRINGWSSLADAKADFLEWMPLLFAYVVILGEK